MNNLDSFYSSDAASFAESYFNYLALVFKRIDGKSIKRFVEMLIDARTRGATVFFIGNGGSASTASHFANDLSIGTNSYSVPFRTISLADNTSILTAVGNDAGYDEVFTRQLRVLGTRGDILVAISASGNSPNLLHSMECARSMGVTTFAITSFDGGKMKLMADDGIHVPTEPKEYGPAEDVHLILNHIVGGYLSRWVQREAAANEVVQCP